MKFVLLLVVLLVAAFVFFGLGRRRRDKPDTVDAPPPPAPEAPTPAPDTMVVCGFCGVHLPMAESVRGAVHAYCCAAHREAGERSTPPPP